MKTIKVIDLLNKIANGEELPKKIRAHYRVFEKYLNHNAYLNTEDEEFYKYLTDLPRLFNDDRDWLNDEVEIIEPEEDNKIGKIIPTSLKGIDNLDEKIEVAHLDTISATDKLNELIDEVNKLKEGK